MVCTMSHQTSWYRGLGSRDYPRGNIPALLKHNLVIPTYRICSFFRSKGREGNRKLKKSNSIKELVYSNSWDNRYFRTKTNLFLITFLLLKDKKELRRYFSRVLNNRDTPREVSDSATSIQASSRINVFTSSRTGMRDHIEWVWRLTSAERNGLRVRGMSISNR